MKTFRTNQGKALAVFCLSMLLACVGVAPTVRADDNSSIVGLWRVHYISQSGGPNLYTFDQWHSDGQEFETANLFIGAVCQGTFEQTQAGHFKNYHVAWTFDSKGAFSGYWVERFEVVVVPSGNTYSGTYTKDFYDKKNAFLFEDKGTLNAIRLTPND